MRSSIDNSRTNKMAEKKQLECFLDKVEEIESIVKGLNSQDEKEVEKAKEKADEKISKLKSEKKEDTTEKDGNIGVNRTVINTAALQHAGPAVHTGMSQEAFMRAMEDDARDRTERRKLRMKEADQIKAEGNEEYKKGNYDKAVEIYSKALALVKDNSILYTNRAMALIKLERYTEALTDCDWALRACPNCLKGFIHQGRAHFGLGDYDKARHSYTQAMQAHPNKRAIIQEYLDEVDRVERGESQAQTAMELFKSGGAEALGVVEVMKKVTITGQLPLFYAGGFRVLATCLNGVNERSLFRTQGGFNFLKDHPVVSRCLCASPKSLSQEELDLLSTFMNMLSKACEENEVNQEQVLQCGSLHTQLHDFLEAKLTGQGHHLKDSIILFLHTLSLTPIGRTKVVSHYDVPRLMSWVYSITHSSTALSVNTLAMLNNLALDQKFRQHLRTAVEDQVLPAFETLLRSKAGNSQLAILPSCINMLSNLAGDKAIRKKFADRKELWCSCQHVLTTYIAYQDQELIQAILSASLGLLMNISIEGNAVIKEYALNLCKSCLDLYKLSPVTEIRERCLGVLGHVIPQSDQAVQWVCNHGGLDILLNSLKCGTAGEVKPAMKCLTICTQKQQVASKFIATTEASGVTMVLSYLKSGESVIVNAAHNMTSDSLRRASVTIVLSYLKSGEESVVGNAALCLSHCVQVTGVPASLADTSILMELLCLARDGSRPEVQQNCAILIAKLAQADTRHLERLRELHGIEILHSCMKHVT